MVDDRQASRLGVAVLGAVSALMMAPSTAWAESPDTAGGSAATRSADSSPPATSERSRRADPGASVNRPRTQAGPREAASVRGTRGAGESPRSPGPARSRLTARTSETVLQAEPGAASEPALPVPSAHSHASAPPSAPAAAPSAPAAAPSASAAAPSAWEAGLAWFQHTFNNATPTFGGQLPTVSAVPGQSSEPIVLGGFDADGDPLSYSISGAGSGSGSAGGVLAITDGSAVYTPPGAWDGTTSYDDEFLVTVTDVGPGWHVHGLAGLLNLLTFGMLGSPGDSATGAVTVRVNAAPGAGPEPPGPDPDPAPPEPPAPEPTPDPPEPDPNPPVAQPDPPVTQPDPPVVTPDPPVVQPDPEPGTPVVAGSFPVSFVNASDSYANDEIHVMVIGQASPGQWSWVDRDGTAHPIDHTAANAADHLVKNGVNYANMSFSLAGAGGLRIPPELLGARIYVSLGEPVYVAISPDNTGWAGPDPANPTDPNYQTVYDWYELSFKDDSVPFGGNTTQVDQFGFPYTFTLTQESSGYSATRGITVSRDELFRRYEATMPSAFQALIIRDGNGDPLRILAPRSQQAGELAAWFDEPVDAFWSKYTGEQFVYNGPGFTVTGGVDAEDRFAYTVTGAGGAATSHVMIKPSTADVFRADGPFIGTGLQGAFLAHLDAAFHRGVATAPEDWDTASAYYPAGGRWNNWAQFFHANSVEGYAYGFPYDDVNSQSSVLILNNPQPLTRLTITIGG